MTLLTAGALTDPRLPATASNVCTTDARLGGVGRVPPPPPPTKILATPVKHRHRPTNYIRHTRGKECNYIRHTNIKY